MSRVDLDARKIDLCLVQPGGARFAGAAKPGKPGAGAATKAKPKAIAGASKYEEIAPPKQKVRRGATESKSTRSVQVSAGGAKREKNVAGRKGSAAAKTSMKKR